MAKKRKPTTKVRSEFDNDWLGIKLPVVSTIKDCRQLSKDHWQGVDTANGATVDVRGGAIPEKLRLLAFAGGQVVGFIRLIPAECGKL
jgi:hypothetical protein